jgi:VanZ family protein
MSLRLDTGEASPSYLSSLTTLFAVRSDVPRKQLVRQVMLRSVRLHFGRSQNRVDDEEQLSGFERGTLPLRIRPAFVFLNVIALILLAFLGFHPRAGDKVPVDDKLLHFICFFFATGLFYCIWDVDEPARRAWIWRHMPLLLTWAVCFAAGGLGSEIVQSLLPYKTFQWGDVLCNFLGSGLGLLVSYHAEKRHRIRREIQRLYEPLDQDLYGDEENESNDFGDGDGDPWRTDIRAPRRQSGQGLNDQTNNKKGRFGGANGAAPPDTANNNTRVNDSLFSIEDEEEEAADAWRDAR